MARLGFAIGWHSVIQIASAAEPEEKVSAEFMESHDQLQLQRGLGTVAPWLAISMAAASA